MEVLKISYAPKGIVKYLYIALSVYSVLLGLCLLIMELIAKNYQVIFFGSLLLALLGIILFLLLVIRKPAPLIIFTTETLQVKVKGNTFFTCEWNNVRSVGIGISSLKIALADETVHEIDLSEIKYKDLRTLKSKIIELCEKRQIPYKNDY